MTTTIVRAVCPHDCPATCAMLGVVQNGVVTKVRGDPDHPITAGALCINVSRYPKRTYHALLMISLSARNFLNFVFVNGTSLRSMEGGAHLDMHSSDAAAHGIHHGDRVPMHNQSEALFAKARVVARSGHAWLPSCRYGRLAGDDGKNENEITNQRLTDRGSAPMSYDVIVQVKKEEAGI